MSKFDDQYIKLCRKILRSGESVVNYSGTDVRSSEAAKAIPDHGTQAAHEARTLRLPHQMLQFDLEEEFPILVSKHVAFKTAVLEMLWIYQQASNDVRWLQDRNIKIWNEWEISANGEYAGRNINQIFHELHPDEAHEDFAHTIGTAYGWIVRRYHLVDTLLETLKHNPGNRRMVMSLWQNEWLSTAALPSCVWNSQWNIINGRLNLLVTSRSSDVPLGLPFNVVQYAVLCYIFAQVVGVKPGQFTFMTNDAHVYENQIPGIKEQIRRYDRAKKFGELPPPPRLWLNPEIKDFYHFDSSKELKDIRLENYQNLGTIQMPVTD